jgi:hypothetical protein
MGWFWNRRKRPSDSLSARANVRAEPGERPIILSQDPGDAEIRAAVAKWIGLMACGDYPRAVASVFRNPSASANFQDQVETFCVHLGQARHGLVNALREQGFNVPDPPPLSQQMSGRARVIPASAELLDAMEIHRESIPANAVAWLGFHVPMDNGFGIWTTMGVVREGDHCILKFEIFHM